MQPRRLFKAIQQNINPDNFSKVTAGVITVGVFAAGFRHAARSKPPINSHISPMRELPSNAATKPSQGPK